MKTRTALVLSVAGVLLTGSAALAVNTRTLGNSSPSFTGTSNEVLLPQNATTPVSPAPAGTAAPSPGDDSGSLPAPAGTGQPTSGHVSDDSGHDAGDDKGGHAEDESEHESSGDDD
ncbi:MAG: hypothetical protein U1D68_02195 [Arthrobacter sp.]|nr:hypothetical protein [Arthrobacter sp.]MDZ4353121.1 hypothetical protein [Arthrobacter sp.]